MTEALVEVIDLLIMHACGLMLGEPFVGFTEHLYSRDTMQIKLSKECSFTAEGGSYGGFLVFLQWKTNADKLSTPTA